MWISIFLPTASTISGKTLIDEGYALMKRLKSFENEVYYKVYEGQMHAFVSNIVSLPTSIMCINEASDAIKQIMRTD